jgi:iron complex transport system substrate-binding protein
MFKAKKILSLLLVVIMILSLAACNKNEPNTPVSGQEGANTDGTNKPEDNQKTIYPFKFTDDSGKEIVLDKAPDKIASGSPAITEIIYAVKGGDKLIGVTEFCNYPEEATKKEKIGDYNGPNIEKLIELGTEVYITDHVLGDVGKQLEDANIKVVILEAKKYEDVFSQVELIGQMLDKNVAAESTLIEMQAREVYVLKAIKDAKSKRVFFEVWHDPLMSSGPGSFMDEMIKLLGSENIASDAASAYAEFSVETLIERNPEVYITANDGMKTAEDIKTRTGYDQIEAIKNDRIYFLDPDVISRPGPRIVEGLEMLAEAIYSEIFNGK